MVASNYITNVAIVGAGGNSGSFMTESLLKTGKHTVTALTRAGSKSKLPEGVISKILDYENPETLIEALRGQDALIIAISGTAPKDAEMQLIKAAGEAGVAFILPNGWTVDTANEALMEDIFLFKPTAATRKAIADLGQSDYIAVSTGFWYEWCLSMPASFGFDFANRAVTFFDDGETKISISTWPQIGRAVAALLSLPVKPTGAKDEACLDELKNKVVYVSSFTVSQSDIFASALRVTGTTEADWTITREPARERFASGLEDMKQGRRVGFAKLCARVFYPDGSGDVESSRGTLNRVLGLPEEDLDEATRRGVERARTSPILFS